MMGGSSCQAGNQAATAPDAATVAEPEDPVDKARSLILLLATLAVTITYQAGLQPPGGVWHDNGDGHNGGDLILLSTHPWQYKVFYYCNTATFVVSIIVVIMVQSTSLVGRQALKAAVLLDLIGLMGAYAVGSCRDVRTSIYIFTIIVAIFVGVVMPVVLQKPTLLGRDYQRGDRKRQKLFLLLAILGVTITYQAGLTPPGKFWEQGDEAHQVGDSIFADNYPRRYKAFVYCNATSFMVSIVVIVTLVNRDLSKASKMCFWLMHACMVVGLMGLLGAFAAGTTRRVRASTYVFAMVATVLLFAFLQFALPQVKNWTQRSTSGQAVHGAGNGENHEPNGHRRLNPSSRQYKMRKYLMLLGVLAASITYQAGLDPPGGAWPSNADGHAAGDPVMHDTNKHRYHAFFYSNSTCFMASVVVIVLLLQDILTQGRSPTPMRALHTVVVLDLLGLLVAYGTGSSRDWGTSGYVLTMAATVLAYIGSYVVLSCRRAESEEKLESSPAGVP